MSVTTAVTLAADTSLLQLRAPLPLAAGGELADGQLAYTLDGPAGAPVVLVQGGISAGCCAAAWWQAVVGPGRAIDTGRYAVLGVDFLGGCGGSSGPANTFGRPFPQVAPADQARAHELLLDHLGIERLHAVVGASYGGMVGLALAAQAPARVARLVAIAAAHRADAVAAGWRAVQRLVLDFAAACGRAQDGAALARALAMVGYRGRDELQARFAAGGAVDTAALADYLCRRGSAFAARFDAAAYRVLSAAIDLHAVDPAAIAVPTTLVAWDSDQLVPLASVRELAAGLAGPVRLHELSSPFGHDAFLKESAALAPILRAALAAEEAGA